MIPEAAGRVSNTVAVRSTGRVDQAFGRTAGAAMGRRALAQVGGNVPGSESAGLLMERTGPVVQKIL